MPPRSPPHPRTLTATTDDVSLSSNAVDPSFAAWTDGSVIDINDSLLSVSEQQATGASTSSTHYNGGRGGGGGGGGGGGEGGADDSTASGSYAYPPGEGSRRSSSIDPPGTPAIDPDEVTDDEDDPELGSDAELDDDAFARKMDEDVLGLGRVTEEEAKRSKPVLVPREGLDDKELLRTATRFLQKQLRSLEGDAWMYDHDGAEDAAFVPAVPFGDGASGTKRPSEITAGVDDAGVRWGHRADMEVDQQPRRSS